MKFKKYKSELLEILDKVKNLNILVVGETIIDEYQFGYTLGKAGKFPIVAFQEKELETYPGGILAICNHLKDFVKVDYFTSEKAIIKKRFIQDNQKLFETYSTCDNRMYKQPNYKISDYDIVIISDFGHGFLDKNKRDLLEKNANFLALNAQINAGNMGMNTINKYSHADYICIDENELRLATSNQYGNIEEIIRNRFTNEIVSITESKSGCIVYKNGELVRIPALAKSIVDTVGAGDAFLSITSPLAYLNSTIEIIGLAGNIAGAIACTYMGNKGHLTKDLFYKYIEELI